MLHKVFLNVVLFSLLFMISSCQEAVLPKDEQVFFSLTDYFEEQIALLEQQHCALDKTIKINEQSETKVFEELDYRMELAAFIASDINRPSWVDKYSVDTLRESGQLVSINYSAKEEKLHTRQIIIHFGKEKTVEKVFIKTASHSVLSDTEKSLFYHSLTSYKIESVEANKAGDTVNVEIFGKFCND